MLHNNYFFPEGQNWIIHPMEGLNYHSNDTGVCHPVVLAAMIEIFSGNLEGFYYYFNILSSYYLLPDPQSLKNDLAAVKAYLAKNCEEFTKEIKNNDIYKDKTEEE